MKKTVTKKSRATVPLREYMRFLNLVHIHAAKLLGPRVFLFIIIITIQAARGLKVSSGSVWPPMPALGLYFLGKVENQSV